MKLGFSLFLSIVICSTLVYAEHNQSTTKKSEHNSTQHKEDNASKDARLKKELQEQMDREKKYAKEQKFYQGDEYNLSEHEVDPDALKDIPVIEPDYDFDITDVYRDDI